MKEEILKKDLTNFEKAKLFFDKIDFKQALFYLDKAASEFYQKKDYSSYVRCLNNMIRIYSEREEFDQVEEVKEKIKDLMIDKNIHLNAQMHYTLARFKLAQDKRSIALEYLEKSLDEAVRMQSKTDMCYALIGLSDVHIRSKSYDKASKELDTVKDLLSFVSDVEISISYYLAKGHIFNDQRQHEEALKQYWKAYEILKDYKSIYFYNYILWTIGDSYVNQNDFIHARIYLSLAEKSTPSDNLKNLSKNIKNSLNKCYEKENESYDIMIDGSKRKVVEKSIGNIDFRNQFILLDLLKLFTDNPGAVYSKQQLTKRIWNQDYVSEKHDNKIYVTIKRLRKLIEPNKNVKYIFRSKEGYYFNKELKVLKINDRR